MTTRERFEAFWAGERPDRIPYSIYQWEWRHTADDPAWRPLFERGLGVTHHLGLVGQNTPGLEWLTLTRQEPGGPVTRTIQRTPVGEIHAESQQGWHRKYWLETADDYRVMTWIVRHTALWPTYQHWDTWHATAQPWELPLVGFGRTPIQTILVDLVGLENFGLHLLDLQEPLLELYDALLAQCRLRAEIIAAGPGRFVSVLENFTAETLGPQRYAEWILPVYEELFPQFHAAGKIVGTHYDGQIGVCADAVAHSPIDLIESFTPPPEGDMTLAQARAAWPEKLLWSNLNVGLYDLPPAQLRQVVLDRVAEGAPDGRRLAFEISEHYPRNWKESVPVVVDALLETG